MEIILTRKLKARWGILSELEDKDSSLSLVTLEHAYLDPTGLYYTSKLPNGVYECVLGEHTLRGHSPQQLYEVTNVPGHTGILFHIGNYNRDSEGCILLGTNKGNECITGSATAFKKFMDFQNGLKSFTLTVTS